jgi:hypothetical protein
MACNYENYYERKKKREIFNHYEHIKKQKCCDKYNCEKLAEEYEDLQHECDDTFRNMHKEQLDEKGLTRNTLCEVIKKNKNEILNTINNSRRGGKKSKSKRKRSRKTRRNTRKN